MFSLNDSQKQARGVYTSIDDMLRLRNIAKDIRLQTRASSTAIMDGDARTRIRGRGMEFAEVRPYQPGDDIRTIDWRVTARTQSPYTKLFQEEKERPVFLLVDQRSPMFFGSRNVFKSVYAAELACVVAWAAHANNDRIGALLFGDTEQKDLRAKRGKFAMLNFIHELQRFNSQLNSPIPRQRVNTMEDMLKDVRRVARPGSAVFLLSDFHDYNEACNESLSVLARHTDVSVVHLWDKLEARLPRKQGLSISDGESKLTLSGNTGKLHASFQQQFADRVQVLRTACQRSGITFASMDVAVALSECVQDTFESRSRKKRRPPQTQIQNI